MDVHQRLDDAIKAFDAGNQGHAADEVRGIIKWVCSQVTEWDITLDGVREPADFALRVQLERAQMVWAHLTEQ